MLFRWHCQASSVTHVPNYVNRQHSCSGKMQISNLSILKLKIKYVLLFAGSECPEGARRSRIVHYFIESLLHTASGQNNCHRISNLENSYIRTSSSGTQSFWAAIFRHRLNCADQLCDAQSTNNMTIDYILFFSQFSFIRNRTEKIAPFCIIVICMKYLSINV